jgi:nitroreductase
MNNYSAWGIDVSSFPKNDTIVKQIKYLSRYGLLAASVHNTQPWKFTILNGSLRISIDNDSKLKKGDPTTRETWISLGACSENIILAAEAFGFKVDVSETGNDFVLLNFNRQRWSVINTPTLKAICERRTNRNQYNNKEISHEDIKLLVSSSRSLESEVIITQDKSLIKKIADLTGSSIKMALSLSEFRAELSSLMRVNWTKKPDGMPGFVLGKGPLGSLINPFLLKHFNLGAIEASRDVALINSGSAIALIFSPGEGPKFWFEAGRTYERTAVNATKIGISNSTFAAAVEAPEVHKEIEELVGTRHRLQAVMRLGYCNKEPKHSPRKNLEEVITENP